MVTDAAVPVHIHYVCHIGLPLGNVHEVSSMLPAATVVEKEYYAKKRNETDDEQHNNEQYLRKSHQSDINGKRNLVHLVYAGVAKLSNRI